MLSCIIVDDEVQDRQNLRLLLNTYYPEIKILDEAFDKESIQKALQNYEPDIIFTEVHLGKITSFDVMEELEWSKVDFKIVFITSSEKHAIQGYKYNAVDYILKPIRSQQLIEVVEKIKLLTIDTTSNYNLEHEFNQLYKKMVVSPMISLTDSKKIHVVKIADIIYCTGGGNFATVVLKNQKEIVTSKKMRYFEEYLAPHEFLRIHKSHLINLKHIHSLSKSKGLSIVMSNGVRLPVSRNSKQTFLKKMNII